MLEKIHTDDADRLELLDRQENGAAIRTGPDQAPGLMPSGGAVTLDTASEAFLSLMTHENAFERTGRAGAKTLRELHAYPNKNAGRSLQELPRHSEVASLWASAILPRLDYAKQLTKAESLHTKADIPP